MITVEQFRYMSATLNADVLHEKLKNTRIPGYMYRGIVDYITKGMPPGGFLMAILENDLREAVYVADDNNGQIIPDYVRFLYNNAPSACWGNTERVMNWLNAGIDSEQLRRQGA